MVQIIGTLDVEMANEVCRQVIALLFCNMFLLCVITGLLIGHFIIYRVRGN